MKLPELPPDTSPAVREAFETLARESADLRAEVEALKRTLAGRLVVPAAAVAGAFMPLVAFLYRSRGRDGEPILRDVVTEG